MLNLNNYFEHLEKLWFYEIFDNIQYPWQPIKKINRYIKNFLKKKQGYASASEGVECFKIFNTAGEEENIAVVNRPVRLDRDIFIKDIFIMEGTVLEPGALIKSPAIIGKNCQVRQGAYIRGNLITGKGCVLGHTTEIKNSILFDFVEAGHFAYIGDCMLGDHVNLGAGAKLANLQLRTRDEKIERKKREITIQYENKKYPTGMAKLGAIIGDNTEIGCNTVTSPGSLISKNSWIYPNTTVSKGFYPSDRIIRMAEKGLAVVSCR